METEKKNSSLGIVLALIIGLLIGYFLAPTISSLGGGDQGAASLSSKTAKESLLRDEYGGDIKDPSTERFTYKCRINGGDEFSTNLLVGGSTSVQANITVSWPGFFMDCWAT